MDTYPITARSLEPHYKINGDQFNRQYKNFLSGFRDWEKDTTADRYLLFEENIGEYLSIDETSLSMGELYTIVENKSAHGKKGTIVAIVKGTKSEDVISAIDRMAEDKRLGVKEVTLDLSESMRKIVRHCFPNAILTIDRFHIQKLASEAVQAVRIKHRWEAIDEDNKCRKAARESGRKYVPETHPNSETTKELLARCRYALFKSREKWTESQKARMSIVFENYPEIKQAYELSDGLRRVFNKKSSKDAARTNLARWYNDVEKSGIDKFKVLSDTLTDRYDEVLNYFVDFSTNANAESFNAKIKSFRASMKGVSDIKYFLFRLTKIYA